MLDRAVHRARKLGLPADAATPRKRLVRSIQRAEGRQPCFGSGQKQPECRDCEWATECRGLLAEWLR
jgi:hypothetical protein